MSASAITPLSQAQRGLWLGYTLNEDKAMFNTAECIAFSGRVDCDTMLRAVRQAVSECECLYCQFVAVDRDDADRGAAGFVPASLEIPVAQLSLAELGLPGDMNEEQQLRAWASEEISQPLDLIHGLPCRFALLHGAERDYLYSCVHHIALDGFGTTLLFQRIAQIYSALSAGAPLPAADFGRVEALLEEEQRREASGANALARSYWLDTLQALPEPASFSERRAPIAARFLRHSSALPSEVWQRLNQLSAANKVSWPDLLLAGLTAQLQLFSASPVQTFGMMVMNRIGSASLMLPSMQMNIVPLCIRLAEQDDLIACARQIALTKRNLRRHQHYRYENLRRDLNRVGGEQRLFGPLINIMPFDHPLNYGDLSACILNLSAGPVEDLTIEIRLRSDGLPALDFDANPACYSVDELSTLQQELFALLQRWLAQPELTSALLLRRWRAESRARAMIVTDCGLEISPVLAQIQRWAQTRPQQIALQQGKLSYSYRELAELSGRAAAALHDRGIGPGCRIGVMMHRTPLAIWTLLAVMRCGATYVPLDPDQPAERQRHIIHKAGLRAIVTQADYQQRLASLFDGPILLAVGLEAERECPLPEVADGCAYIMFTSGSTGLPKGVAVGHRALEHFIAAARQRYAVTSADRLLQFAPFNFDASIEEIFGALTTGATLVLRTDEMLESMPTFIDQVARQSITLLDLPTAFWNEWVVSLKSGALPWPETLRAVIIGGEAVYPEQLAQWQRHAPAQLRLINTYGPTEATVVATSCDLQACSSDAPQLPIGLPLPGVSALILAAGDRPAEEGELVLFGPTLAQGYLDQEDTAFGELEVGERFLRGYRTGDRVRRQQGQLLYLGRQDNEFKISGYRIQPAEVENRLLAVDGIDEACVQGIGYGSGVRRLVAFIAVASGDIDVRQIKQRLAESLPLAMIPTDYRLFAQLPKTGSNKVDRKRLLLEYQTAAPALALASETENRVSAIWQQILGVSAIHSQDNFFQLGGQSLQTIQIVNRLAAEFAISIKVSEVFDHPQLGDFCRYLDDRLLQDENSVEMVW